MSVSSYSQQNNWPAGATSLLISGQSTTGSYTYPTSLSAGVYAVQAYSLNKDTTGAYITATSNAQVENIANAATGYINLTTTESSFTLRPLGAAPTTYTSLFQTITSVLPNGMYGVAYGGGKYVFFGANTASALQLSSASSPYGAWSNTVNGDIRSEIGVGYGGGKFFVPTQTGVTSSTNGITWTTAQITGAVGTNSSNTVNGGVFYANNLYFAFSAGAGLYTSTDAITWTTVFSNFAANRQINQGVYANSKYTAVGSNGSVGSVGSDLRSWYLENANFGNSAVNTIFYGNSLYVAAGAGGTIRTSTDAITWATRTSSFGSTIINEVTYGNGIWVAVGASGGQLRTSTDTITWTLRTSQFGTSAINGVAYGAGVYIAVGAGGRMTNSTDGTTWTAVTSGFGSSIIHYVTHTNGLFVAVGVGGRISSSTDGTTWTGVNAGTSILQAATYFNGNYIVAGSSGNIWASTDLITWTQRTSNSSSAMFTLVHNGTNQIWAGGSTGFVNVSTDGITWSGTNYGNPNGGSVYSDVAYGNGRYVVASGSSLVMYSTDATTWTTVATTFGNALITYGANAGFMVNDSSIAWAVSTDAITWTVQANSAFGGQPRKLIYTNESGGLYVTLVNGVTGSFYISSNGAAWTAVPTGLSSSATITQLAYDGTQWIAVNSLSETRTATSLQGTWSNTLSPTTSSEAMAVNGNTILFGTGTSLYRTFNGGTSWALFTPPSASGNYFTGLYAGGRYLLAANNIYASTDAVNWDSQNLVFGKLAYGQYAGTNFYFGSLNSSSTQIYYNTGSNFTTGWSATGTVFAATSTVTALAVIDNRVFVGAGDKISVSRSASIGDNFVEVSIAGLSCTCFAGNAGKYYVFGNGGQSFSSTDGATWTRFLTGFGNNLIKTATYSNGLFLIAGAGSQMASSTDGVTWTLINSTPNSMNTQAVESGTYYFSGDGPTVYKTVSSYPMYYAIYGVNPNTI